MRLSTYRLESKWTQKARQYEFIELKFNAFEELVAGI